MYADNTHDLKKNETHIGITLFLFVCFQTKIWLQHQHTSPQFNEGLPLFSCSKNLNAVIISFGSDRKLKASTDWYRSKNLWRNWGTSGAIMLLDCISPLLSHGIISSTSKPVSQTSPAPKVVGKFKIYLIWLLIHLLV